MARHVVALLGFLIAAFAAAPVAAQSGPTNCTTVGQNAYVRDVMRDLYLWYQHLPNVSIVRSPSPEAYLDAVRYRPLDSSFSYITTKAANDAFYSDSQFIGYGLSTTVAGGELRVLQVFGDSPASEAGLGRGDRLLEVDGRNVGALIASGQTGGVFGPSEIGVQSIVRVSHRDGREETVTLTKRLVTIPTVSLTRVIDVDGRKVGYLHFRNFVRPSVAALDAAFASLSEARVDDLVLDLRYNGGGLVDVAVHLASVLGGAVTRGNVFAEYRHNDRNTRYDETVRFEATASTLDLSRLFVIATSASASASELVINSLRPFMPVVVIGDRTYGKPVGQYGIEFCEKVLFPVAFSLVNANGEGDYFGGIPADCPAADDIEHELGAPEERSLAEALHFVRAGACSPRAPAAARTLRSLSTVDRTTGWQSLVNAH